MARMGTLKAKCLGMPPNTGGWHGRSTKQQESALASLGKYSYKKAGKVLKSQIPESTQKAEVEEAPLLC